MLTVEFTIQGTPGLKEIQRKIIPVGSTSSSSSVIKSVNGSKERFGASKRNGEEKTSPPGL